MDITPIKLHGAIKLGSTSVLLNNIDKYDLSDLEKGPLERFRQTPPFWQFIRTLPGKLYVKIEKKLLNSFGANGLQVQKEQNLTLPTLKNDL